MTNFEQNILFLNESISYNRFIEDVYYCSIGERVYFTGDFYKFLVTLFANIISSHDFEILEADGLNELSIRKTKVKSDVNNFFSDLNKSSSRITLFTSGTTGTPKAVVHEAGWFLSNTFVGEKYKKNVWAFTYNPTHMAGLQVIFQAVLNRNSICYLYKAGRNEVFNSLSRFKITNISATPSFYRLLSPLPGPYYSIKRLTSGGEKLTQNLINQLKESFPNAKINNIFATTEFGSLLISRGDCFSIPQSKADSVRIFESKLQVLNPYSDAFGNRIEEWFDTGDVVEVISEDPLHFRFTARNNNFVNVGGERVNIEEVEKIIDTLGYVKLCRVFLKRTSVIDILCAELILNDAYIKDEAIIKMDLRGLGLINARCPQIINIVDNIALTRTGKIIR